MTITDDTQKISIVGQIKNGFWLEGLFIVPGEGLAYYRDNEGTWRYISLEERDDSEVVEEVGNRALAAVKESL